MKETRNLYVDFMKGGGILLVVLGHSPFTGYPYFKEFIFSFHMPLFFILSGYFHNSEINVNKLMKTLLRPYLLTSLISILFIFLIGDMQNVYPKIVSIFFPRGYYNHVTGYEFTTVIGVIWFLIALFWCKLIYSVIYCYCPNYKTLLSFMISILAILIHNYFLVLPLGICEGLQGLFIYNMGCSLRNNNRLLLIYNSIFMRNLLLLALLFLWIFNVSYSSLDMAACKYGFYLTDMIGALCPIAILYIVSKWIHSHMKKAFEYVCLLGRGSLLAMCIHSFMFLFCSAFYLPYITNAAVSILIPIIYKRHK